MPSTNDYLHALREAVSNDRYPLAVEHLSMARRFLTESRRRELEFAKDAADRLKLLDEWFGEFLSKEVKHVIALLAEARNINALDEIGAEETGKYVVVTTARPLSESLKEEFMQTFGAARVDFKTDPSLIGGVKIRVGDKEVDNSLRARLERLASIR